MVSTTEVTVGQIEQPPEFISADAVYDGRSVRLRVRATQRITIVEIQGAKRFIESLGASLPAGFSLRWFADDRHVPKEMMDDIAGMNLVNFRWGGNLPVQPNADTVISIPVTKHPPKGQSRGRVDVVYERRKLFGLVRERTFFRVLLNMEGLRDGA